MKTTMITLAALLALTACGTTTADKPTAAAVTVAPTTAAPTTTELTCGAGSRLNSAGTHCEMIPATTTTTEAPQPCIEHVARYVNGQREECIDGEWGPTPVVTTPPKPTYTVEDMNAILGPPAAAWLAAPSVESFGPLAAAAQSMLDSGNVMPDSLSDAGSFFEAKVALGYLATDGIDTTDNVIIVHLNALALDPAIVPVPFILDDGAYLVGSEVPAGKYRAQDVEGCYWETLDEAGEINDNNFINDAPQVLMTVRKGDYSVNSEDCGPWIKVG